MSLLYYVTYCVILSYAFLLFQFSIIMIFLKEVVIMKMDDTIFFISLHFTCMDYDTRS